MFSTLFFRTLLEELNQLKTLTTSRDESHAGQDRENDVMNEIKLLRQHKTRHESRVKVLEDHNRQLQQQLAKLKQLLEQVRSFRLLQCYNRKKPEVN